MKAKQIKKLLKGLVDNYCDSIDNEKVVEIIKNNTYITGGCIPSMLIDEYVNDFDFYFYHKADADVVKKYYETRTEYSKDKYKIKLITDNSINLTDKVQFVIKFTDTPEVVINNFDWAHIKSYFEYPDKLNLVEDVYKFIIEKELVYTGSQYPVSSLLRTRKFLKKGWTISTGTMLHIVLDVVQAFSNPRKNYTRGASKESFLEMEAEKDFELAFNVDEILYHLNGVDPLTMQVELEAKTGKQLSLKEIISLISQ